MKCVKCRLGETRVVDSRPHAKDFMVRRRRVCERCDHKFNTYEAVYDPTRKREIQNRWKKEWRKRNPERAKELDFRRNTRREARKQAALTGVPVEQLYEQYGVA